MKTNLLLLFLLVTTFQAFGQIKYERGYVINNEGVRIDCFIYNYDWNNNPTEISYKVTESGEVQKGNLTNIQEFKVDGSYRYVRVKTKIDQSSMDMAKLSAGRNPEWVDQTQFLKVLVEGKAVLYSYVNSFLIRFFYSVSGSDIQQLIYKEWLFDKGGEANDFKLSVNNTFKQQLSVDVPLPKGTSGSVATLTYTKSQLEKYFKKYNAAYVVNAVPAKEAIVTEGSDLNSNKSLSNRPFFNIKIAPGVNFSSLSVNLADKYNSFFHSDFKTFSTLRYGLEAEVILPFNKNKWSVVFEGNYQKSEVESIREVNRGYASLDYASIDLSSGIRNYYFINNNFKVFFNAFLVSRLTNFDSKVNLHNAHLSDVITSSLDIKAPVTYAVGGGCEFKSLSFECRWAGKRNLIIEETGWEGSYSCLSFILGYKIFQMKK